MCGIDPLAKTRVCITATEGSARSNSKRTAGPTTYGPLPSVESMIEACAEEMTPPQTTWMCDWIGEQRPRSVADSVAVRMQITAARLQNAARTSRSERIVANYTTGGHTGQMVPLFASGPGAEAFGGMIDNYRIGQMLLEIVRRPATPARRRRE